MKLYIKQKRADETEWYYMNNNYIEQKKNTHLYFKLGTNQYAVNSDNVLEIMKLPALEYPQKLPNNIIGLLKYNNFVINVIDIRFYLNIEVSPYDVNSELLIVKTDETILGIITDKVIGVQPFDSSMVDTIPFVDNKTIIDSLYKLNQETIFIINIYAIEKLLKEHNYSSTDVDIQSLFPKDSQSRELLSRRTLEIAKKARMKISSGELHAKNKYISFILNNDTYCIPLEYVTEVLKDTTITNVPGTPDCIEGIMNLRGDYITVINLKKFFGFPVNEENYRKPVIIIQASEFKLAFLIDKINELFDFQQDEIIETGEGYFLSEFINNGILYTILNVDRITTDKKIVVTDM